MSDFQFLSKRNGRRAEQEVGVGVSQTLDGLGGLLSASGVVRRSFFF